MGPRHLVHIYSIAGSKDGCEYRELSLKSGSNKGNNWSRHLP